MESTGRSALTELRNVMGLLTSRARRGSGGARRTAAGAGRGAGLVRRMCDAGLPVELIVSGDGRPVPSGVGLAAYRVVQEALTNTVRHAAGATATVTSNTARPSCGSRSATPAARPGRTAPRAGRGLIGLRERLAVYGGSLRAGDPARERTAIAWRP